MRAGDIVTHINGRKVKGAETLRNTLGLLRVGEIVKLKILREGRSRTIQAKIVETVAKNLGGEKLHAHLTGAVLADIEEDSRLYGHIQGVLLAEVERGSPAWGAGLRSGDVITSVNRKEIKSVAAMRKLMNKSRSLLLNIRRGNGALFLYLQ